MCGCSLVSVIVSVIRDICIVCVLSFRLPSVIFVGISRHTFYSMFDLYLVPNLVIRVQGRSTHSGRSGHGRTGFH